MFSARNQRETAQHLVSQTQHKPSGRIANTGCRTRIYVERIPPLSSASNGNARVGILDGLPYIHRNTLVGLSTPVFAEPKPRPTE